jgi:hypothetical protein
MTWEHHLLTIIIKDINQDKKLEAMVLRMVISARKSLAATMVKFPTEREETEVSIRTATALTMEPDSTMATEWAQAMTITEDLKEAAEAASEVASMVATENPMDTATVKATKMLAMESQPIKWDLMPTPMEVVSRLRWEERWTPEMRMSTPRMWSFNDFPNDLSS